MTVTQDPSAPLVVVVGATGAQGSSVIKALSESNKPYRLRGFTRDPTKPIAKEMAAKGVEMVVVEPKPENKDLVTKAFEGADTVFAVTVLWMQGLQLAEGKMLVDAAKAANVKQFIWSGQESMAERSGGKYKNCNVSEEKNEITKYARASGIPIVVNVIIAMFMENFKNVAAPKKQADGSYAVFCVNPPETLVQLIYTSRDYGLYVQRAIEAPGKHEMYAYTEMLSWEEMCKQLSEVTGKNVVYVRMPDEAFVAALTGLGLPEPAASGLLEGYVGYAEFPHSKSFLAALLDRPCF
ncbi:hypothetical protein FRB94_002642 [Tulasnella sp. JGI-2019a]|nr:hypothetical protein FRB94_002642 [Tulasnella sp. JGI-2019a]KAG9031008.1 hypothetical protein FRB95_003234 [Tulasnella sp. JGI-2019a]